MSWEAFLGKAIAAGSGALVSLGLAYVAVGRELAYIKGAMAHIVKAVDAFEKLRERHVVLERDVAAFKDTTEKSLRAAHDKLRVVSKQR